jgi:phosphohistidine phosphatase SixA
MKYNLLLALLLLTFVSQASDSFTIYLTRHAEKQLEQKDPHLTECGAQRAQQLAIILEKVEIATIYSTEYKRTMETAEPTAKLKDLAIQQYSPRKLALFAKELLKNKESALVVGHSNTTPQLSALLSQLNVSEITEKEYQNLYQIQISSSGKVLTLLTQPLTCH